MNDISAETMMAFAQQLLQTETQRVGSPEFDQRRIFSAYDFNELCKSAAKAGIHPPA